jgi:hypothetical protein
MKAARRHSYLAAVVWLSWIAGSSHAAEPLPESARVFLEQNCVGCHDDEAAEAGVKLDVTTIDWSSPEAMRLLERVYDVLADDEMPPATERRPDAEAKRMFLAWLDASLISKPPVRGTEPRRLNMAEYERSVREVTLVPTFKVPRGFPPDGRAHGFDTVAEGLVMSPAHLQAYVEAATAVADMLFPQPLPVVSSRVEHVTADELALSSAAGQRIDGRLRLVARSDEMVTSCTWPAHFEAPASGKYRLRIRASTFRPHPGGAETLAVFARSTLESQPRPNDLLSRTRELGRFDVLAGAPSEHEATVVLDRGDNLILNFASSDLDHSRSDKKRMTAFAHQLFTADPRLLAAYQRLLEKKSVSDLEGGSGWNQLQEAMADDDLDMSGTSPGSPEREKTIANLMFGNPVNFVNTLCWRAFELGPALDIHDVVIEGPLELVKDRQQQEVEARRARLLGVRGSRSHQRWISSIVTGFLSRAFRRPPTAAEIVAYERLVQQEIDAGRRLDDGLHLMVRTALTSPHFLLKEQGAGGLDAHELAARLSYMLTQGPPDPALRADADAGALEDRTVLRRHAKRLLRGPQAAAFVDPFTSQWLETRLIASLMPEASLGFQNGDGSIMEQECRLFVAEILRDNRPLADFIDSDFTYTSPDFAKRYYGLDIPVATGTRPTQVVRVSLDRGGRVGGILGQAGVMMATANGVDTQPVIRGKWVLDTILNDPVPPPPSAVPAITPDTRGAKTIRDLMAAHTKDTSCAACHKKLDPLGFALENFDAVGKWRDAYPIQSIDERGRMLMKAGPPVDATGTLPDGTALRGVTDLKRYVVGHIDRFTAGVAEKVFIYGAGRVPSYADRKAIREAAAKVLADDGGFRDLVLAVIETDAFRSR